MSVRLGWKIRADVNRKYGVVKLEMTNDIPNCTAVGGNNRINIQTNVALSRNAQCLTLSYGVRVFVYKMQMCVLLLYMDGWYCIQCTRSRSPIYAKTF